MKMKRRFEHFGPAAYALFAGTLVAAMLLCVCVGSVSIPLGDTLTAIA